MSTTTLDPYVAYNPERLATQLRERQLPGQRSKTAITKLRRERAKRTLVLRSPSVTERLSAHLVKTYGVEIRRRGGETSIQTHKNTHAHLRVVDRHEGLALLHVSGWRYYSSQQSHSASLSYLCGREDGQLWAVRVPGTVTTVRGALAWVTPAAVSDARSAGRSVIRQGDVYAVATTKRFDGTGELPEHHTWHPSTRVLSHPEHGDVHLPHPVRFIPQRVYGMGRGAGRACGD